jgi:hypothetical protein
LIASSCQVMDLSKLPDSVVKFSLFEPNKPSSILPGL